MTRNDPCALASILSHHSPNIKLHIVIIICMSSLHAEFGFAQTTLTGSEQAEDYEIEFGFLQGWFDQELQVTIDPIYHTASECSQY